MNPDNLMVDEIILGRSSYLKRIEFKGRGRVPLPPPSPRAALSNGQTERYSGPRDRRDLAATVQDAPGQAQRPSRTRKPQSTACAHTSPLRCSRRPSSPAVAGAAAGARSLGRSARRPRGLEAAGKSPCADCAVRLTAPARADGGRGQTGTRRLPYCRLTVYVREIRSEDAFAATHLPRRRPRWKSGSVRM